jgi:predicted metal-dependent enzyme (double-stranded beta helix superfamily)
MSDLGERLGLPGRIMSEEELTVLVRRIASEPELWRPLVRHTPEARHCVSLHADDDVGIWVISWMPGHDTGLHDHAGSHGAVLVVEGDVIEGRPEWSKEKRWTQLGASEAFTFDEADVHRVLATGDGPAVTIHAYSPPLQQMGVYDTDEHGQIVRSAISWDQVLTA